MSKCPVRRCVDGHALAVADDQRGVRPPGLGGVELLQPRLGLLHASSPTRSHFTKLKMPGSERPPARSRMSWLCSKGALMGRPAHETFGHQPGPTYGNRSRSGSTPSTGSTPSAGHRMGRGKGALASPLRLQRTTSTPTYRASFAHVCASKTRGGSLGLRAYSMTPGATRLSKLVGCALSLSVFSLWQSPHSACKVCTLPAKACLTGTTWSSSQAPAVSPQPHSAHLPPCPAKVFCLSAALGTSRFALSSFRKISARPAAGPGTPAPVPRTTSAAPRAPPAALGSLRPASASARSTAPGC